MVLARGIRLLMCGMNVIKLSKVTPKIFDVGVYGIGMWSTDIAQSPAVFFMVVL